MQSSANTLEPTIRTANNTADTPVPYTENEAKNKLKSVVQESFAIRITVNRIKHSELLLVFNHINGGKYYLKPEYHGNDKGITDYINENKNSFSFLKI